jgi:DNA-binding response OmpR family regulator
MESVLPSALAIVPGPLVVIPDLIPGLSVQVMPFGQHALEVPADPHDLLVLAGLTVDEQQAIAALFQEDRHWRVVPVLYVLGANATGFAVPGGYRPEIDGLARGTLNAPEVQRRMRMMAREGTAGSQLVVAGVVELDPARGLLRAGGIDIELTTRETEVLAILLARAGHSVTASEIIERAWGVSADERYLQILRRHVSNIRAKLGPTPAASALHTVRGSGYRFLAA